MGKLPFVSLTQTGLDSSSESRKRRSALLAPAAIQASQPSRAKVTRSAPRVGPSVCPGETALFDLLQARRLLGAQRVAGMAGRLSAVLRARRHMARRTKALGLGQPYGGDPF